MCSSRTQINRSKVSAIRCIVRSNANTLFECVFMFREATDANIWTEGEVENLYVVDGVLTWKCECVSMWLNMYVLLKMCVWLKCVCVDKNMRMVEMCV